MIINVITKPFGDGRSSYQMETSYTRLTPNVGVVGDTLARSRSTFETFNFVDYASQFKSSDFDVQSILAVGAYDLLKPTYISTLSNMDFADKFQNFPSSSKNA